MGLFLCLSSISLGLYCQKNVVKSNKGWRGAEGGGGVGKMISHIGDSKLPHTMSEQGFFS